MAARAPTTTVGHPYPVVFDAFVAAAPTRGYRLEGADRERGRITLRRANTRITVYVGAVDAVTTAWSADASLRVGVLRDRHEQHFAELHEALQDYLTSYYA